MGQDEKKGVGKRGGGKRGGLHQVVITREQFPKLSLSCLILDSWCLPLIYVRFRFFELSELDLVILLPQFRALQPTFAPGFATDDYDRSNTTLEQSVYNIAFCRSIAYPEPVS